MCINPPYIVEAEKNSTILSSSVGSCIQRNIHEFLCKKYWQFGTSQLSHSFFSLHFVGFADCSQVLPLLFVLQEGDDLSFYGDESDSIGATTDQDFDDDEMLGCSSLFKVDTGSYLSDGIVLYSNATSLKY